MLHAPIRNDTIPPITSDPLSVDESERGYAEVGFSCEACGTWLGRLYERKRSGVRGKKGRRIACCRSPQKSKELLACSRGKAIRRMAYDVRVNVFGEMKSHRESAGICIGSVVRNQGQAGPIGEPHRYRRRVSGSMRRARERDGFR